MKTSIQLFFLVSVSAIILTLGCSLNPQQAKEKMAFNNFMVEIKATNFMEGKIGNVKYTGSSVSFDFTDSSLTKDDIAGIIYHLSATYVNANNKAQTGVTVLKLEGYRNGQQIVKSVYQAGPSKGDDITSNTKLTWFGEFAEAGSGTTTPPAGTTGQGTAAPAGK